MKDVWINNSSILSSRRGLVCYSNGCVSFRSAATGRYSRSKAPIQLLVEGYKKLRVIRVR